MKRLVGIVFSLAIIVGWPADITDAAPSPVPLAAYGADASAAAIHALSATNALSNFRNGFVDNSYPLAATHMDASPATTAAASVFDTGPGGAFLNSQSGGKLPQTQYALAGSPGTPAASVSQSGTIATSAATPTSADARSAVASTTAGGPRAVEPPGSPAATDGDAAESHVIYDEAAGTVTATSRGSIAHASFGAGVLTIDNLTVVAAVKTDATKATLAYSVSAGAIKVAGTPVSVTDQGISVASPVPGAQALEQQVVDGLNGALNNAGIKISAVAPTITKNGPNATIDAAGLVVQVTAPDPNPSIPSLVTKIILGEARAFAFETPGIPVVVAPETTTTVPLVVEPSISVAPPDTTSVTRPAIVVPTTVAPRPAPVPVVQASGFRVITTRHRPVYLLYAYLAWQSLIIGTCAAVAWWRMGIRS